MGCVLDEQIADQMQFVEFTAQSKMSGVDLQDGTVVRKGAFEAMKTFVKEKGGKIPEDLQDYYQYFQLQAERHWLFV